MQDISLEVILKVVFGINEQQRFETLQRPIVQFAEALQSPMTASALFFPALQKDFGPIKALGLFTVGPTAD